MDLGMHSGVGQSAAMTWTRHRPFLRLHTWCPLEITNGPSNRIVRVVIVIGNDVDTTQASFFLFEAMQSVLAEIRLSSGTVTSIQF